MFSYKKKAILISILLIIPIISFSQENINLGKTKTEINKKYKEYMNDCGKTLDSVKYCLYSFPGVFATYYFNKSDTCLRTDISTIKAITATDFINKYNKEATILDSSKWRYSFNGVTYLVQMTFNKQIDMFTFTYTKE